MTRLLPIFITVSMMMPLAAGSDVVLGILGTSAFIECQLPVSETLVWEIQYGGIIAMNGTLLNENSTKYYVQQQPRFRESLVIYNVTLADDNKYRCYDVTQPSVVDSTELRVLVKPAYSRLTGPQTAVLEGQNVTLTCKTEAAKPLPYITWYIQDVDGNVTEVMGESADNIYRNGTGDRTSAITVHITREMYRASIICNISLSVFYQETLSHELDVLLAPVQPTIDRYEGSFDIHVPLSIQCTSTGSRPTATILWFLDGVRLGDSDVIVKSNLNMTWTVTSILTRTFSRDQDGCLLTCAATNQVLEDLGLPPVMTNVTLKISRKPYISIETTYVTTVEGSDVILRCDVVANPFVESLYWLHDGELVKKITNQRGGNSSRKFELVISHVTRSDVGEYTCLATNRLGTTTGPKINLDVQYTPFCADTEITKRAVRRGQTISLPCNMMTSPDYVTITWRYHHSNEFIKNITSTPEQQGDNFVQTNLKLLIRSSADYGVVECKGSNSVGVSTKPCLTNILPPSAPDPPRNCTADQDGVTVIIHCIPAFNGGSPQHFLLQTFDDVDYHTVEDDVTTPYFNLHTYTNTSVRVCAENTDFPSVQSCSTPLHVTVDNMRWPKTEAQSDSPNSSTYIIVGVLTALIGVVIIASIITVLILKQRKDRKSGHFSTNDEPARNKRYCSWLPFRRSSGTPNQATHTVVQRGPDTIAANIHRAAYPEVRALSSTPHHDSMNRVQRIDSLNLKSHRNNNPNDRTKHTTDGPALDDIEQPTAPDVFCERTGFAMSPINPTFGIHNETANIHRDISSCQVSDYSETTIDEDSARMGLDTDEGLSNLYNTKCILEGLGNTSESMDRMSGTQDKTHESETTGSVNIAYSIADIVDVFGDMTEEDEMNVSNDEFNVNIGSRIDDESLQNTSDKTTDLDDPETDGMNDSEERCTANMTRSHSRLASSSATNMACDDVGMETAVRRSYSLPYRCNRKNQNRRRLSGIRRKVSISPHDTITDNNPGDLYHNINDIDQHNKDDNGEFVYTEIGVVNSASSLRKLDFSSIPCSQYINAARIVNNDDERKLSASNVDQDTNANLSVPGVNSDDFQCEFNDSLQVNIDYSELEWDRTADLFVDLNCTDSFLRPGMSRQQLRSDSFLEAVTGVNDELANNADDTDNGQTSDSHNSTLIVGTAVTEQAYFNHGYEFDESGSTQDNGLVTSEHVHSVDGDHGDIAADNETTGAEVDVVAFF